MKYFLTFLLLLSVTLIVIPFVFIAFFEWFILVSSWFGN